MSEVEKEELVALSKQMQTMELQIASLQSEVNILSAMIGTAAAVSSVPCSPPLTARRAMELALDATAKMGIDSQALSFARAALDADYSTNPPGGGTFLRIVRAA